MLPYLFVAPSGSRNRHLAFDHLRIKNCRHNAVVFVDEPVFYECDRHIVVERVYREVLVAGEVHDLVDGAAFLTPGSAWAEL